MTIHAKIYSDEDAYYTAEVPALQGCIAQGLTFDEAKDNLTIAVHDWLECMEAKNRVDYTELLNMNLSSDDSGDSSGDRKLTIHIKVIEDVDGTYTAEVPALNGCVAQGLTIIEAKENLKIAVHDWLENMEHKNHVDENELIDVQL
jgi:predicted RNase H-like HicB family nuclease